MNILNGKHWLKSLRKENKDFARVGWILDYGLRFREEKGEGGWEKKTNEDIETTSVTMKRLESTWREMHRMKRAENQRSENPLHDPKEKIWRGRGVTQNTYVKIPHQSDEGDEE